MRSGAALRLLALGLLACALAVRGAQAQDPPARAAVPVARPAVVNINTAQAAELLLLPGIGPARAQAILEYRRSQGAFLSVDELARVPGIGPRSLERLRPFCAVSGPTTARVPRGAAARRR
jgi:competence protein ComEA